VVGQQVLYGDDKEARQPLNSMDAVDSEESD
jgi:hypothetical protein